MDKLCEAWHYFSYAKCRIMPSIRLLDGSLCMRGKPVSSTLPCIGLPECCGPLGSLRKESSLLTTSLKHAVTLEHDRSPPAAPHRDAFIGGLDARG